MGSSFKMFKAILLACLVGYASCCTPSFFEMLTEIMTPTETTITENPGTGGTGGTGGDCQCGKANRIQKIVGGQTTEENEYPWQVGLSGGGSVPFCGGSLISKKHVLTAAHCTQSSGDYYVLLGDHSLSASEEKRVKVCNVKNHPNYNDRTLNNDYSVLTLCEEVEFTDKISPVCLPSAGGQGTQYEGKDAIVSGWGTLSSGGGRPDKLQDVTVKTMSNSACCSGTDYSCSEITKPMICASTQERTPARETQEDLWLLLILMEFIPRLVLYLGDMDALLLVLLECMHVLPIS